MICATLLLNNGGALAAQSEQDKFEPVYANVLASKVNIRAGQGLNFEVLGQFNRNAKVVVIGEEHGWYKIKLPKEALCFVRKDYVDGRVVTADRLRVRAGEGQNFNILGILTKGERIDILEERGDWLRISPPESYAGWIKKEFLQLSKRKFIPKHLQPLPMPQKPKVEAKGIVDDLGNIINRPGRHKLVRDKKILYYLKSENIDLNQFVYQKVWVSGEPEHLEGLPYPVINVERIRVVQ